jgi:DNA-binding response OmpR family regulator
MVARPLILVVEDDGDMRSLYRDVLQEEGYSVAEFSNSWLALASLPPDPPALVISAVRLASLPGWEFVEQLQVRYPMQVPVLYVTAVPGADLEAHVQLDAWTAVLAKPFDLEDLLAAVARLVER